MKALKVSRLSEFISGPGPVSNPVDFYFAPKHSVSFKTQFKGIKGKNEERCAIGWKYCIRFGR